MCTCHPIFDALLIFKKPTKQKTINNNNNKKKKVELKEYIELEKSWGHKGPLSPSGPNHVQAGTTRAACTGPCPGSFWRSPERETPEPCWAGMKAVCRWIEQVALCVSDRYWWLHSSHLIRRPALPGENSRAGSLCLSCNLGWGWDVFCACHLLTLVQMKS